MKYIIIIFVFVFIIFQSCLINQNEPEAEIPYHTADINRNGYVDFDNGELINFFEQQIGRSVTEVYNYNHDFSYYPRNTNSTGDWQVKNGNYGYSTRYYWTLGFFPGALWYVYRLGLNSHFEIWARSWTEGGVGSHKDNIYTHDLGFMIFNSFGNGYKTGGEGSYMETIINAANTLNSSRFRPVAGVLDAGDWAPQYDILALIDTMMNLEILFWASKNGGNQELYDNAVSHARMTAKNHVRSDGSTYHVVNYSSSNGEVLGRHTNAGYNDESTWARGQAWAVYGFTMTYRETGLPEFLETAEKVADYFVNNLPQDNYIPYWDFKDPGIPNAEKDTSSAAISTSGLLELSILTNKISKSVKYYNTAYNIVRNLSTTNYLADPENTNAILSHSVGSVSLNSEVNVSHIYTDYYFIESIYRLLNL